MKKYQISPAQLIELIKNSQLNSSGNKTDSSLITSAPADRLTERKNSTNLNLSAATSSTLNTTSFPFLSPSPSSSTKSSTLAVNRNDEGSKIYLALWKSLKEN